jgi:hypothetical protein
MSLHQIIGCPPDAGVALRSSQRCTLSYVVTLMATAHNRCNAHGGARWACPEPAQGAPTMAIRRSYTQPVVALQQLDGYLNAL